MMIRSCYGIVSLSTPRVAAGQAFNTHPDSLHGAILLHGLLGVSRTTGGVAAG